MIHRLAEADRAAATALLRHAPAFNLYLLSNLETYGCNADFCQFWADLDGRGRVRAVLNRYMAGWTLYGLPQADWAGLGAVVDSHPITAQRLQDNPGGVETFLPYLHRYRACWLREEALMRLDQRAFRAVEAQRHISVRRATLDDLPALIAFYADAEQMARPPAAVERPLRDRRIWIAEQEGTVAAAALTNAEIAGQAMIGGVYTAPAARGQGLSQAVVSALCRELLAEGKEPVLYWENPIAGAVYRKLGFHQIGVWRSIRLEIVDADGP